MGSLKMKEETQQVFTGIDIGATKVCVVIAGYTENQPLEILGVGISPSQGMKKGVVINISDTVTAISEAVTTAEQQSGVEVDRAWVGISGEHIRGLNNTGVITVSKASSRFPSDQEITDLDRQRVLDHAQSITLPLERRILHVLPQEFKVDDYAGIKDPEGMMGHRLEARVHLITCALNAEKNMRNCCEKAGIEVAEFVVQPLASSYAVFIPNEKKLGVALLDIGGGTTDVIVYFSDGVHHTGVIPYGGESITSDIAHGVQTTLEEAERLKCAYGIAKEALADKEVSIEVPGTAGREGRSITQKELASYIEPRMKEILMFAFNEFRKSDHPRGLNFGIVLTGGGAKLSNIADLAQEVFNQPIKIGIPILEGGGLDDTLKDPAYATAVGLVKYGVEHRHLRPEEPEWRFGLRRVVDQVKRFFRNWY